MKQNNDSDPVKLIKEYFDERKNKQAHQSLIVKKQADYLR